MDFFTAAGHPNSDRAIIEHTYHIIECFLRRVTKYGQCLPGLPVPRNLSVEEPLLVIFHRVEKFQTTVFQIMVVDPIFSIIE